jgi:hypothetical protein
LHYFLFLSLKIYLYKLIHREVEHLSRGLGTDGLPGAGGAGAGAGAEDFAPVEGGIGTTSSVKRVLQAA